MGLSRLHVDDDVRRMQSLDPDLLAQQARIEALIGAAGANQFFLVQAADDEAALRLEEALVERLSPLVPQGVLGGFQAAAQYVPSAERQRHNRELLRQRLDPLLPAQMAALGLEQAPDLPDDDAPMLTLAQALAEGPAKNLLASLLLESAAGEVAHVVLLDAPRQLERPARRRSGPAGGAAGRSGRRLQHPVGQVSAACHSVAGVVGSC